MREKNSKQGFGLATTGLALLAAAFFVTFYLQECIFGVIMAVLGAVLSTAAHIEAGRAGGPRRFTLTILIITWLGAIFSIIWTASSSQRTAQSNIPVEIETSVQKENEADKEQKMKELEEKLEELEEKEE